MPDVLICKTWPSVEDATDESADVDVKPPMITPFAV
jgi:hypothetical protein